MNNMTDRKQLYLYNLRAATVVCEIWTCPRGICCVANQQFGLGLNTKKSRSNCQWKLSRNLTMQLCGQCSDLKVNDTARRNDGANVLRQSSMTSPRIVRFQSNSVHCLITWHPMIRVT